MNKRERKAHLARILKASAARRGLDRKTHFASGGDLSGWRGRHTVFKDRKREASRRKCRGRYRGGGE